MFSCHVNKDFLSLFLYFAFFAFLTLYTYLLWSPYSPRMSLVCPLAHEVFGIGYESCISFC